MLSVIRRKACVPALHTFPCPKDAEYKVSSLHYTNMATTNSTRVKAPAISSPMSTVPSSCDPGSLRHSGSMTGAVESPAGEGGSLKGKAPGFEHQPDLRRTMRFASWTVITLNGTSFIMALSHELARYRVSVAGITECRFIGSDMSQIEYTVLSSGGTQCHNGVPLFLHTPFAKVLTS